MLVNSIIIVVAGSISALLQARPRWVAWQRRITGTLLGAVTVVLARQIPERARV